MFQASILKKYPAKSVVVFFYFFFSTILSLIVSLVMVRDPSAWSLKSKTRLISVLFSVCRIKPISHSIFFRLQTAPMNWNFKQAGDPRPCFPSWCHDMVSAEDRASVCFYLRTPGDCHNSYSECHLFRGCSESRNVSAFRSSGSCLWSSWWN